MKIVPFCSWVLALCAFASADARAQNLPLSGQQIFERYCAACHGVGGEGNGFVSPLFKVAPPSLIRLAMSNGGAFPRERVRDVIVGKQNMAAHGERRMPVWGKELPPNSKEMSRLLNYLESVQRH